VGIGKQAGINRGSWQWKDLVLWYRGIDQGPGTSRVITPTQLALGPSFVRGSDHPGIYDDPEFGRVGWFDIAGSQEHLESSVDADIITGDDITIIGWFFIISGGSSDMRIIHQGYNTTLAGHDWMMGETGNELRARVNLDGTTQTYIRDLINFGTWQHLGFVSEAGRKAFFYDGQVDEVSTSASVYSGATDNTIAIGDVPNSSGSGEFDGRIADLRVYNRALTDEEAYQLYQPQTRGDLYDFDHKRSLWVAASAGTLASDSQPAYITGTATTSDSQSAYIAGGLAASDSQQAYTEGVVWTTDSKQAYIAGLGTLNVIALPIRR